MTEFQPRTGDLLGRYELLLPIATGGMAQIFLARLSGTRGFRKIVAVKTILRGALDDVRLERMFIEEATLASQIHHPNVVEILDFGEHLGTPFIVMEWVEGEPLNVIVAEAMKSGGLPLEFAVNVIGQACKGLHAAHELTDENGQLLGVVHRDISPQNIIVSYTGTAKLLDFGIAKATAQVSSLTEAGEVKGKFAYMSPEQVSGGALDRRSDVFSLGVLTYLLTTGRHPFRGENSAETVRNIYSPERAAAPSSFVPGYPPGLEWAVMRALEKSPDARWGSAHAFLAALEATLPECLESTLETKLGAYMTELFGSKQAERRRLLRMAEERSGNGSGSLAAAGSNGSLGAVAIDARTSTTVSLSLAASTPPLNDVTAVITPRRWSKVARAVGVPITALALVAFGFMLSRALPGSLRDSAGDRAPSATAAAARSLPAAPSPAPPPPSAAAPAASSSAAPANSTATPGASTSLRAPARTPRITDGEPSIVRVR